MNHNIARWHSLTLSPADRAILDQMEEEMTELKMRRDAKWSTDMGSAIPAAHVMVSYWDDEWIFDIIASWDIGKGVHSCWTHWKPLPLTPDEEERLDGEANQSLEYSVVTND